MPTQHIFGSVDGASFSTMVWSEVDFKCADGTKKSVPGIVPNNDNEWGKTPYFLVKTSTKGYENITFTAGVSGSKKGPRDYKLQYSTDGTNYTDVTGTKTITANKDLTTKLFDNISVSGAVIKYTINGGAETVYEKIFKPFKGNQLSAVTITAWAELDGHKDVILRINISSDISVKGGNITGVKDGSTYINNIILSFDGEKDTDKEPDEPETPDADEEKVYYKSKENYERLRKITQGEKYGEIYFCYA